MWLTGRQVRAPRGRNRPTPCSPHTHPRPEPALRPGGRWHGSEVATCTRLGVGLEGEAGHGGVVAGSSAQIGHPRGVQPPRATPPTRQPTHGLQVTPWVPRPVGLGCFPASRLGRSRFDSRAQQTRGPSNAPSRALLPLPELMSTTVAPYPPPQDILSVPCSGPLLPLPAQVPCTHASATPGLLRTQFHV